MRGRSNASIRSSRWKGCGSSGRGMEAEAAARARVAVVVPCYNDAATLPETLASLEQQERHELVVVDDGSDQLETVAVLDDLAAGGVQVIRQPTSGTSA